MDFSRFRFTFSLFRTIDNDNNSENVDKNLGNSNFSSDESTITDEETISKDILVNTVGKFGTYHVAICSCVFFANIPTGWVQLAIIFFAAPTTVKCTSPTNITDACSKECLRVEYDRTIFKETIITEWDLICDRAYLADFSQTIVMFGVLMGGVVFSFWSDKQGRRITFVTAGLVLLASSLITSFVPSFWLFCSLRFVTAFGLGGLIETSAEVIEDIIEDDKREATEILSQIPFNVGHGSLPICAYFIRHWRYFNFSFSMFCIIYIFYACLFPESPRWLLKKGNVEKAIQNIERAARCNRKQMNRIRQRILLSYSQIPDRAAAKKVTTADLFRSADLRTNTLVMCSEWFFICFVYFGVSQYMAYLNGNIFVNIAVGAWLSAPSTSACVPMSKYMGRRCLLIVSTIATGLSLLLFALISLTNSVKLMMLTAGLLTSSMTMPQVHLYGGEVFPSYIRHEGVRLCFVMGRLGAMLSPFIVEMENSNLMLPALLLGIFSLIISFLCLLMPSIKNLSTPRSSSSDSSESVKSIESTDSSESIVSAKSIASTDSSESIVSAKSIESTDTTESTESNKRNEINNTRKSTDNIKTVKRTKTKEV